MLEKKAQQRESDNININMAILETIPTANINPNAFLYYFDPEAPAGRNWYKVKVADVVGVGGGITSAVTQSLAASVLGTQLTVNTNVIDITRAQFRAKVTGSTLIKGCRYNITDPLAPLTKLWVDASGLNTYYNHMSGMVNNGTTDIHVECHWDAVSDKNTMIYNRALNNLCARPTTSSTNCIINFNVTNPRVKNATVIDSNITLNLTNTNIDGLFIERGCSISFNKTTINALHVASDTSLTVGDADTYNITRSYIGPGQFSTFNAASGGSSSMTDCYIDYTGGIAIASNTPFANLKIDVHGSNHTIVMNPNGSGLIDLNGDFANGSNIAGIITPDSIANPLTTLNALSLSPNHWEYIIRPSIDGFKIQDETVGGGNILYQAGGVLVLNGATKDDIVKICAGNNTSKASITDVVIH